MSFHYSQETLTRLYKNSKILRFSDSQIFRFKNITSSMAR